MPSGQPARRRRYRAVSGSEYSVTEFKLPELGENIDQGDLVRLMVSLGASVTEGQPVMELETDKAVVEVPSSVTGTVNEIRVKEGQKVKVGQVIFTVENGAGAKAKAPDTKPVESEAGASRKAAVAAKPRSPSPTSRCPEAPPASTPAPPLPARRSIRIQIARVRREHRTGRSGAADDFAGRQSFRRPAGHGTGDRQGRGRSAVLGERHGERDQGQGRHKDQSWPGDLHPGRRRAGAAARKRSTLRSSTFPNSTTPACRFRRPLQAEGKTEAQALPPDQPQPHAPKSFAMPAQLGKVAGTEHRAACSRSTSRSPSGPRSRRRHLRSERHGPGRAHQRR